MRFSNLVTRNDGPVRTILINRPEKLNALDLLTIRELERAFREAESDKSCKVVILSGAGGKAFSAGADIKYLEEIRSKKRAGAFADRIHRLYDFISNISKPTIAAVSGYCLGGGSELALSCDMRVATMDSVFGQPEVKIGIIPGAGGTVRLPAVVGMAKAKELIFTGELISADEALRIGLVNRVVPKGAHESEAMKIALKMNDNSYHAIAEAKKALRAKFDYKTEKAAFLSCFGHRDSAEGFSAFLDHRKPSFSK